MNYQKGVTKTSLNKIRKVVQKREGQVRRLRKSVRERDEKRVEDMRQLKHKFRRFLQYMQDTHHMQLMEAASASGQESQFSAPTGEIYLVFLGWWLTCALSLGKRLWSDDSGGWKGFFPRPLKTHTHIFSHLDSYVPSARFLLRSRRRL